jgi:hypothetical protein
MHLSFGGGSRAALSNAVPLTRDPDAVARALVQLCSETEARLQVSQTKSLMKK